MSKQHVEGLLTRLHARFADSDTSAEQKALMQQMRAHFDSSATPDRSLVTMAEKLMLELKDRHPYLAEALRELIDELGSIGI